MHPKKADHDVVGAVAPTVGLSVENVKEGLKRLLPIMKTVATLTPNKVDDAAVAFIEALVNS